MFQGEPLAPGSIRRVPGGPGRSFGRRRWEHIEVAFAGPDGERRKVYRLDLQSPQEPGPPADDHYGTARHQQGVGGFDDLTLEGRVERPHQRQPHGALSVRRPDPLTAKLIIQLPAAAAIRSRRRWRRRPAAAPRPQITAWQLAHGTVPAATTCWCRMPLDGDPAAGCSRRRRDEPSASCRRADARPRETTAEIPPLASPRQALRRGGCRMLSVTSHASRAESESARPPLSPEAPAAPRSRVRVDGRGQARGAASVIARIGSSQPAARLVEWAASSREVVAGSCAGAPLASSSLQ